MSRGVALGPDTDVTNEELCLGGDEPCKDSTSCPFCKLPVCDEHNPDALACAGDLPKVLHHWACRADCPECRAFFAAERRAKAGEDWS